MANRKNKVVRYLGLNGPETGNIRYWDGSNWVFLGNGDSGDLLVTHGTVSGPTWEAPGSVAFQGVVSADPNSGTGAATEEGSKSVSMGMGDVHLMMGGSPGSSITYDRQGREHTTWFPFNAGWNCDDNGGFDEIDFLIIINPIANKRIRLRYSQKSGLFPGPAIENIKIISEELDYINWPSSSSSSKPSYTPTGSCTYSSTALHGDGECNITFDSSDNINLTITGTYWDGSQEQSANQVFQDAFSVEVGGVAFKVFEDSRDLGGENPYVFFALNPYVPAGIEWQKIADAGGEFGGLWWDILDSIRTYSDGQERPHPDLQALGYSDAQSTIGCWGLFPYEISSSSSSSSL